jgi:hypothetical protein
MFWLVCAGRVASGFWESLVANSDYGHDILFLSGVIRCSTKEEEDEGTDCPA